MIIHNKHSGYSRDGVRLYHIPSDTPDTSGQQRAAVMTAEMSQEQLAWAKEVYKETAPQRADAIRRANMVSDAQMVAMGEQSAISRDYNDFQKNTFRPLEKSIVTAAQEYDTESRRNARAGQAVADVTQNFAAGREQQTRGLMRMGVNPSGGKFAAMNSGLMAQEAIAKATGANKAREGVELQGYARKMDAANLGRGLSSSQATSAGVALNQGNSAAQAAASAGNVTAQGNQIMNQGYGAFQSGMSTFSGIQRDVTATNNAAAATDGQNMQAAGAVAGMAIAI